MIEHAAICREIGKRWPSWEYLYIDMFAGPGYLVEWPDIPGSPIIALECIRDLPFRAIAFEENQKAATALTFRTDPHFTIFGRWQDNWIRLMCLPNVRRCGLIYADPNTLTPCDMSLVDGLSLIANTKAMKYCDILLHIPATAWKRVRGVEKYAAAPTLIDALKQINKPIVKVSAPDRQWQWIFALLTRYENKRFGKVVGWHDIESDRGRMIINRITKTERELVNDNLTGWLFRPE